MCADGFTEGGRYRDGLRCRGCGHQIEKVPYSMGGGSKDTLIIATTNKLK